MQGPSDVMVENGVGAPVRVDGVDRELEPSVELLGAVGGRLVEAPVEDVAQG